MKSIQQGEKGLFEILEERNPDYEAQSNTKNYVSENLTTRHDEELKFEFLVQDMFLDHFFP
jgi:hypothetical protein